MKVNNSKGLSILIMVLLIVIGLAVGGMNGLNSEYNKISKYKDVSPIAYNMAAEKYNDTLDNFPANLMAKVLPVKGPLELVKNPDAQGTEALMDSLSLGYIIKVLIAIILGGGLLKLLF